MVPRTGIQHIQVGRAKEIEAIFKDINRIAQGGSAFRLIIGEYGSGKTFFLNVIRSIALEKKLVAVNADLSPDRRIHASAGQARNLYSETHAEHGNPNQTSGQRLNRRCGKIHEQRPAGSRKDRDVRFIRHK